MMSEIKHVFMETIKAPTDFNKNAVKVVPIDGEIVKLSREFRGRVETVKAGNDYTSEIIIIERKYDTNGKMNDPWGGRKSGMINQDLLTASPPYIKSYLMEEFKKHRKMFEEQLDKKFHGKDKSFTYIYHGTDKLITHEDVLNKMARSEANKSRLEEQVKTLNDGGKNTISKGRSR